MSYEPHFLYTNTKIPKWNIIQCDPHYQAVPMPMAGVGALHDANARLRCLPKAPAQSGWGGLVQVVGSALENPHTQPLQRDIGRTCRSASLHSFSWSVREGQVQNELPTKPMQFYIKFIIKRHSITKVTKKTLTAAKKKRAKFKFSLFDQDIILGPPGPLLTKPFEFGAVLQVQDVSLAVALLVCPESCPDTLSAELLCTQRADLLQAARHSGRHAVRRLFTPGLENL